MQNVKEKNIVFPFAYFNYIFYMFIFLRVTIRHHRYYFSLIIYKHVLSIFEKTNTANNYNLCCQSLC